MNRRQLLRNGGGWVLTSLIPGSGGAEPMPADLRPDGVPRRVQAVVDGDTVILADQRRVRLTGIQAPELDPKRPDHVFGREAKAALAALAEGREVELWRGGAAADRHGRTLAHLRRTDGVWLQAEMLRRGMARVYTFPDARAGADALLGAEAEARRAKRGLWAIPFYAVREADDVERLARDADSFQIVRGEVVSAARPRDLLYLNFGRSRGEFTVEIAPAQLKELALLGIDPRRLVGRMVEVRGWIQDREGPRLRLTHAEQLAVDPPPP